MKSRLFVVTIISVLAFSLMFAHPGKDTKKAKKASTASCYMTGDKASMSKECSMDKASMSSTKHMDEKECAEMMKSGKCDMKTTSGKMDCCVKKSSDTKTENNTKSNKNETAEKSNK